MKAVLFSFSFLVQLIIFPGATLAEQDPIVTTQAYGNNRDDAMLQARREAVAQGIGMMLTSKTEVNNFVLKKDIILTKVTGGVKKITVLEEREEKDGGYFVKIRAILARNSIKKDLMALHLLNYEMNYPRLLVLLKNDRNNQGTVVVTDYLISKGFHVVDPATISGSIGISEEQLASLYRGSTTVIVDIGEKSGADYLLLGDLEIQAVNNDFLDKSGLRSYRSTISARIIDSRSGTVLASKIGSGSAAHLSAESARVMSTEKAAERLLDEALFDQLIDSFQNTVNNGFVIKVHVTNVESYSIEKKLRMFFQKQKIVSLHSKGFSHNSVDLTVHVKGNTTDFCDHVDRQMIAGQLVTVSECRGDQVVIELNVVK